MLLAETLFDPELHATCSSRLMINSLSTLLSDSNAQSYFLEFVETEGTLQSKKVIKFWVLSTCLTASWSTDRDGHSTSSIQEEAIKVYDTFLRKSEDEEGTEMEGKVCGDQYENELPISAEMRSRIKERISDLSRCTADVLKEAIRSVESHVVHLLDLFQSSPVFLKYQIDVMTKGNLCLSDVLFYDPTLFHFLEFMDVERSRLYVDFLLMINNFRSIEAGPLDSEVLWLKFFEPESIHFIPFSEGLRKKVKEKVEGGIIDAFDEPQEILHQYIEKTYFRQFLESQIYIDFLTERINCLQKSQWEGNANKFLLPQQQKCHSFKSNPESTSSPATDQPSMSNQEDNCIPDNSISTTSVSNKRTENEGGRGSRRSDRTQDHDNLWSRDFSGRLQIAHVDRYGKVISDLQPEPDCPSLVSSSSRKSGLSQSFLKFVRRGNNDTDPVKLQEAWKAAEDIVNDVINITLEYS
jgi:A-kinase anchor protein 10